MGQFGPECHFLTFRALQDYLFRFFSKNIKKSKVISKSHNVNPVPHFFAVTSGPENDASLRFHAKIGTHFHKYRINAIHEKSLNFICAHPSCKSKAKLQKIEKKNI